MDFKLTFIPDEEYYKEAYTELVSTKKLKRWEPLFACIMIVFWLTLYFVDSNKRLGFLPIVFLLYGIYNLYKINHDKKKWLKDRTDSKVLGREIEIEFTDEFINHSGPFSTGKLTWTGINAIKKTRKGVVINQSVGTSIYLPDKLFTNQNEIDYLLSKSK